MNEQILISTEDFMAVMDAYAAAYKWTETMPDELDSDAAVRRCMRRRFEEAVGKRVTRLLKERDWESLYAMRTAQLRERVRLLEFELRKRGEYTAAYQTNAKDNR